MRYLINKLLALFNLELRTKQSYFNGKGYQSAKPEIRNIFKTEGNWKGVTHK